MQWYEVIRELRLQKEGESPGNYTATACAHRAGMSQPDWSRMEAGRPRKQDGSPPEPTIYRLKVLAVGLGEPVEVIYKAVGVAELSVEPQSTRLVILLESLLRNVPLDERPKYEDKIVQMARILLSNAA